MSPGPCINPKTPRQALEQMQHRRDAGGMIAVCCAVVGLVQVTCRVWPKKLMVPKVADGGPEVDSNCIDGWTVACYAARRFRVPFAPGLERDADSVSLAGNLASVKACVAAVHH